jgi:aspartyl protease family protein
MGDDATGKILAVVLLVLVVVMYGGALTRKNLSDTTRNLILWGLIFMGVLLAYGLRDDVSQALNPTQSVFSDTGRIEAPRQSDGHYYLTLKINGTDVEFVVDTGATDIVLSMQDAERIGIDVDDLNFSGRANTANGEVRTARVRLADVRVGGYDEGALIAYVNQGELFGSLLGMAYLQRFGRVEISNDKLTLER